MPEHRAANLPSRLPEGIDAIVAPIQPMLDALDDFLATQVLAFEPEVRPLVEFTFGHSGKKIRPILVFYGGWRPDYSADQRAALVRAAGIVELVHLATLVHDDILDGAELRHNTDTVTRRYGAHTAVLLGDALFAHALQLAAEFPAVEVCRRVARATRQVCSGEIAQTFARGDAAISIPAYYRMIGLKTAELFAVSARLGALLSDYPPGFAEAAEAFARHVGIAYQIYDDLADLVSTEARSGKTLGTDLQSGKFTLPFLLLADRYPPAERAALRAAWIDGSEQLPAILERFAQHDIFAAVRAAFAAELDKAARVLAPFADLPAAAHLPRLAAFVGRAMQRLES